MVSYAHAGKTQNERSKTQSSAQYNHMQLVLIGSRLGGWSLGLTEGTEQAKEGRGTALRVQLRDTKTSQHF